MKRQAPRKDWLDINETILEVIALAQYQLRRNDILLETQLGRRSAAPCGATGCSCSRCFST